MKFKTVKITTICLISFAHVSVANPSVWYVDAARQNDDGPGDTPETAWQIIQTAINNAAEGDTILVAPGIYDQGGSVAEGVTNRVNFTKPLILKAISTNPADTVIVGAPDPETERGTGPNAVRGVYLLGNATLSGFTITNGHTGVSGYGGGVLSQNNSSTISNCVITGSTADRDGGGTSGGTIFKSIIEGNRAYRYGGGTRSGKIVNSEIRYNMARGPGNYIFGGGAYGGTLINCLIKGNRNISDGDKPRAYGGGTYGSTLINCIVVGTYNGGSFGASGVHGGTAINTTITGNTNASTHGAVHGSTVLQNSIVWGNWWQNNYNVYNAGTVVAEYSCAPELDHGVDGNITNNPAFLEDHYDFRLKWRTSPCLNTGNNTFIEDIIAEHPEAAFDMDGNPRILQDIVDMGAYEYKPPPPGSMLRFF